MSAPSPSTRLAAAVPVKRLDRAKARLADALGRAATGRLVLAMLGDVLDGLLATPRVARVLVVTADAEVADFARAAGAEVLLREDEGPNAAVAAAEAALPPESPESPGALLVVLGDVPGAGPTEIGALAEALDGLGGRGVVLAPARDGGTSALLRAPAKAIAARFGEGSAAAHRALAKRTDVPLAECALPGLAVDVDTLDDLRALAAGPARAPRTRAWLRAEGPSPTA